MNIAPALLEAFEASTGVRMTEVMFDRLAAAIETRGVLDAVLV